MDRSNSKTDIISPEGAMDDCERIFDKAFSAFREGRLEEAKQGCLEVLKRKPDRGEALNALGTLYLERSRTEKAVEVFEKAAGLVPPICPRATIWQG